MSDLTQREVAVFNAARRLPASERAAYLDEACAGEAAMRQRLDELLQVSESAAAFLEQPAHGDMGAAAMQSEPLPRSDPLSEKPGDRIGRYKLLENIGEGGCGIVYVAEQTEPVRRRVALKVIKLGMDTRQVVARFEAERQALAMMDHPNIAKVLDAGSTDTGRPYFVMELVRGIRITDYCDQNQLTTKERLNLFIKVCQAIQHAHQKGVIHRDIKPSNILVTLHDVEPVPKIIDFGIAKATEGRLTEATLYTQWHQFIGTPAYMSPEQAGMSGLDIDTRSDIYSLGVLLYELLASRTPFDAKELMASGLDAMRKTILEKEPMRPSTRLATLQGEELTTTAKRRSSDVPRLMRQLKGDLDWIVMKCLEKDRRRRYETANGLARDLRRHLDNEPVVARPPSMAYRLQKAWRRNKLALTALAMIVGALAVGIVASSWEAIEAKSARNAEKEQRLAAQAAQQAEKQAHLQADAQKTEARHLLYVAEMNLAQQAWEQNNLLRLRQLLEETRAFPDRGFEWYYWQNQTHLALKTLRGHTALVKSVLFSPDGKRILTASSDCTAIVWDAASGKELITLKGHILSVNTAAFSPDGLRIVTGSDECSARLWEAASGRELFRLYGHSDEIKAVAFSRDGQRILTGSTDGTARVWQAAAGKELLTLKGHKAGVTGVAFAPDGQHIVTGSRDQSAIIWDAASGQALHTLKGHSEPITSVAISDDGQRIVTGSMDQTVKVWEMASGRQISTLRGHTDRITSVAFSTDGTRILTGSADNTAKVWDVASGQDLLTLKGHSDRVLSVAFSPDNQRIVTGSWDKTAKVWQAGSSRERLVLKGHSYHVTAVAFSPDSQKIATGSEDSTAKVWDAASGRLLLTLNGHSNIIRSLAYSPDGRQIVTGSWDMTAKVWDAASGQAVRTLKGHSGGINAVAFSPDSQRIVTGSMDNTARVWDAASGQELCVLKGHTSRLKCAVFSPDGRRIVTAGWDKTAKVWEAASGRNLLTLAGHDDAIFSVAYSPDGQRIVTGCQDGTAKVWDAANGRELLTLKGHIATITSVTFSPDGRRIVSGSEDRTAKVWEAASGRELLTLKGHTDGVLSVAYSPDGQRIATGSSDNTAVVWTQVGAGQVAAWEEEERNAAEFIRAIQREQTAEADRQMTMFKNGAIKNWLILAPIPLAKGESGAEGLDLEQIRGEGKLQPKEGDAICVAGGVLKWRKVVLDDYFIDFNAILGQMTEFSVAYAVCYIRSEADLRGLQMLVGSDDESKVYLNGKPIYKYTSVREFAGERDSVPDISLNAGLNVLVFKVVNEISGWFGTIRFADAQGNPIKGIKMTLDPEASNPP